jgi:hypothetical protein
MAGPDKKVKVPHMVKNSFSHNFPGIDSVTWTKRNGHYNAIFVSENKEVKATYNKFGEIVELHREIHQTRLSTEAQELIKNKFSSHNLQKVVLTNDLEGKIFYSVLLEKNSKLIEFKYNEPESESNTEEVRQGVIVFK